MPLELSVIGEGIEAEQEAKLGTYLVVVEGRALTSRDRYGAWSAPAWRAP